MPWRSNGRVAVTAISRAITALTSRPACTASRAAATAARYVAAGVTCSITIAVGGGDRLRGRSEFVVARPIVLDACHPAVAAGRLDHHHTRDDDLAGLAGNERDPPDAHGSDAERRPVIVGDRGQGGGRLVEWDTPGDATTRQADAVADEQIAIAAGDVVEVERSCRFVGDVGGGTHQRSRVPVNSCATPSVS